MRVFLAGKVDAEQGAWRDALLDRVWVRSEDPAVPLSQHRGRWQGRWVLPRVPGETPDYPTWPQEPNQWVLGQHQYVGPFVVQPTVPTDNRNTGDFHGNTWVGFHSSMDEGDKRAIVEANRRAIRAADLCFCYINTPDCFGTLVELGYAAAYRVYTYVLIGPDAPWAHDDYWYAGQMADSWAELGNTPLDREVRVADDLLLSEQRPATPEHEAILVRTAFRHALTEWTTRPPHSPTASQEAARQGQSGGGGQNGYKSRIGQDLVASYSSIAQWTSDPRVRNEAARMLGVLGAPVPSAPGQRG